VRLVRGTLADPAADRTATDRLVAWTREYRERGLRVWTPPKQVAFGPRDARTDGYERARSVAASCGYPPLDRETGGRAVAFTGETVAFVETVPVAEQRRAIADRYDRTLLRVAGALATLGIDCERGEPTASFCPGTHSLQAAGGKIVGVAQRVRRSVAVVAGVVLAHDRDAVAAVLDPVYDALDLDFDPASVGSVARAGGDGDPPSVVDAVRAGLADDVRETVRASDGRA